MANIVQTSKGRISGLTKDGYTAYLGIPYAKPPVGELRWKAPQQMDPWEGVYEAVSFGNICPQTLPDPETPWGAGYYKEFYAYPEYVPEMSEDCLYLNVWTPDDIAEGEKLPVAFWIHGGGFGGGYGSEIEFDGEAYCEKRVVYVTINYRVGIFGFFAHPWLAAENENGLAGNYGCMDQIAALNWVWENIEAFGGDRENITVFGQSAGCMSTQVIISSDLTRGKVAKAILQSGVKCSHPYLATPTLEEEMGYGQQIVELSGISSIEELRAKTTDELMAAKAKFDGLAFMNFDIPLVLVPCVDGYVLKETVTDIWAEGKMHPVPTMCGYTLEDLGNTPENVAENKPGILAEECADWSLKCEKAFGIPSYVYYFHHALPGDEWGAKAFHSSELWYTHGTLGRCWRPMADDDFALSEAMVTAWTDFMKTGEPGGDWRPYQAGDPYVKEWV